MAAQTDFRNATSDELRSAFARYAAVLRRRWPAGAIALGLVGSISFWCSQYLPRQYHAATVFERRDDAVLQNLVSQNSPYGFDHMKSSLTLDTTGLRAQADAAMAIGILPPGSLAPAGALSESETRDLRAALGRLAISPSVRLTNSSAGMDVIELSVDANSPGAARRFVVALRDRYIARMRQQIRDVLNHARDFFEGELDQRRADAARATDAIDAQFGDIPDLHSRDPLTVATRLESLREENARLDEELAQLDAQISARRDFLTTMKSEPVAAAPAAGAAPTTPEEAGLQRAIRDVENQISDAIVVKHMTAEHPTVQALRRKLDALKAVRDELQAGRTAAASPPPPEAAPAAPPPRSPLTLQVTLELDTLMRQREVIGSRLDEARSRYDQFSALSQKLTDGQGVMREMEDRVNEANASTAVWRQRLAQLEQIAAAESEERGTRFTLLEEPLTAVQPRSPRLAAIFTVCIGLALSAAVALMMLLELLDRSVSDPQRAVRAAGAPILETIGEIATPRMVRARRLRRLIWSPALLLQLVLLALSASLALASFVFPSAHHRIGAVMDGVLHPLGIPEISNASADPREAEWEP